jgi:hypothetical protein
VCLSFGIRPALISSRSIKTTFGGAFGVCAALDGTFDPNAQTARIKNAIFFITLPLLTKMLIAQTPGTVLFLRDVTDRLKFSRIDSPRSFRIVFPVPDVLR